MSISESLSEPTEKLPPVIAIRDAAPDLLTLADLLWGDMLGHASLGGGHAVSRATRVALYGPEDEAKARLTTLAELFADPSYTSDPVVAARLKNVVIELAYGAAMMADGAMIEETMFVARATDPSLSFLAGLTEWAGRCDAIDVPVVHVFHRSSAAYGHFVLDALVTLNSFVPAIRARRLGILLPPYVPRWAVSVMEQIGIPAEAIHTPDGRAVRCAQVIIPSSLRTRTSFLPDPARCGALRDRLMSVLPRVARRRGIYLSRANQTNYSQRRLVNEDEVVSKLAARGFEILEPGNMPFIEQVRAFAESDVIVGAHGSTFGNLVFARPGATIVDLMPADWVGYWEKANPPPERWLLNLTSAMGQNYELLLCRSRIVRVLPEDDTSGLQKMGMESSVDLDRLAQVLDGLPVQSTAASTSVGSVPDQAGSASALDLLGNPLLDAPFRQPVRLGAVSAWWGHVPFARWLIEAARPNCVVELGSHFGVSFFNFCQAVLDSGIDCRCHAVDTWEGDAHAGQYGSEVHDDFKAFLDAQYGDIAEMHRCTFDEALDRFPNGSVDILHIDGLHTYEAVRHDFEMWLPKLSSRGVVLFHDANERQSDFGVWRLWEELCVRWPGFLFSHSHGLGVLCVGPNAPLPVLELCSSDHSRSALLRERFEIIGERWHERARLHELDVEIAAKRSALEEGRLALETERAAFRAAEQRAHELERSISWRVTSPLRSAHRAFPGVARLARRTLKVCWWAVTLQLPSRLAERRAGRGDAEPR